MNKILRFMHYSLSKLFNFEHTNNKLLFNAITKDQTINSFNYIEHSINLPIPSSKINSYLHFPELEVLKKITNKIKLNKPILSNYLLVAGQHILNTTGSLLEWVIKELSLPAENIYLIGKPYSNAKNIVKSLQENFKIHYQINSRQIALGGFTDSYDTDISLLWNKLFIRLAKDLANHTRIDGIFVLDDGGHLLKKIPADIAYLTDTQGNPIPIIGIEQTGSGINASKKFPHPIIEVATAAAKHLEAPMIARLTEDMLIEFEKHFINYYQDKVLIFNQLCFGVVGLGKIGTATIRHLKALGYNKLIAFDYDHTKRILCETEKISFAKNIIELMQEADVILGCTGTDFMNTDKMQLPKCINIIENNIKPYPKMFISLSSNDIEFNSLLTHIHHYNRKNNDDRIINPLTNIVYPKHNPRAIIISGGIPFNFMRVHMGLSDYSIPPNDIQLVRGLLAVAILQAHQMMLIRYKNNNLNAGQYKLDPVWQSFVVQSWLECTQQPKNEKFDDLNWISNNSGGILWDPLNSFKNLTQTINTNRVT